MNPNTKSPDDRPMNQSKTMLDAALDYRGANPLESTTPRTDAIIRKSPDYVFIVAQPEKILISQLAAALAEKETLEASVEAMREALEKIVNSTEVYESLPDSEVACLYCKSLSESSENDHIHTTRCPVTVAEIALSTSAGADLLARHREIAEDLIEVMGNNITSDMDMLD